MNRWLRELGVFGQRSHEKRIPASAFRLSNRQAALLLRHLWATDGTLSIHRSGVGKAGAIVFTTCSRGLAEDVAALLNRFAIVARIRTAHQRDARPGSTWRCPGPRTSECFSRRSGPSGLGLVEAQAVAALIAQKTPNTNVDTLPTQIFEQVKHSMRERGLTPRAIANLRGVVYNGSAHFSFAPSRALIAQYADILEDDVLKSWATSDLFWDRVVAIVSAGEEEVFDLTGAGSVVLARRQRHQSQQWVH